ncbi:HNH endonuclease [Brevundimonas sp.]|uniref:HNH endonuclease n=1 Tax=Brevundimonas sp. TaxID=1871086 RepID=UPI002FD93F19
MEARFSRAVVTVVAQRAANTCANPDCGAVTSGPAEDETRAVNVGEAAHIFGAQPGSARFDPAMEDVGRADVTNAIWLCRNCHKRIDADPQQFPSGLLFEWKRDHETRMASVLGKAGALARERFRVRELEPFAKASYLAQQIVLDRPEYWEYKLTAELLRTMAEPVLTRWRHLERGLYTRPSRIIDRDEFIQWHSAHFAEMSRFSTAFGGLINEVFAEAWGEPGVAGSEIDILRACHLFVDLCEQLILWEEKVRFAVVPDEFEEVRALMVGIGGRFLVQLALVPPMLTGLFSGEAKTGVHRLSLELDLPPGWVERHAAALKRAQRALSRRW